MRILLTYGLFLYATFCLAQSFNGNIKIENITFPEGNQLAYAVDIAQDSTGLIWMRADWDFYTYDGHTLSRINPEVMGFPQPNTRKMFASDTHPYFYMVRDSLIVFDPVRRKIVRKTLPITNIDISTDNVVWGIRGENGARGIFRSANGKPFQKIDSLKFNWYFDVTLVRGEHFFVKCRDRIETFDSSGRVKIYSFPPGVDPVMPSMVQDKDNTIWVIHSPDRSKDQYGVYYLKEGQDEFVRLPEGHRFPQEKKEGHLFSDGEYIWHRGYPFSLSRLNINTGIFENFTDKIIGQSHNFPFYNSTLLNVFRDRSGERWLTTRAGVVKLTIEEDIFQPYHIEQDQLGCPDGNCLIKGVTEDEAGNIYFSYDGGIRVLDPQTGQTRLLSLNIPPQTQKVHGLTYSQGTLFWNEYAIDLKTGQSRKLFPSSNYNYLTHGLDDEENILWIGVNDFPFELYQYDIQDQELETIHLNDTLFANLNCEIRQIHISPSSRTVFLSVWLRGLLEFDLNGEFRNLYTFSNMYGLHEDKAANLWFGRGSESGLYKMDLKTKKITEFPYQINSFTGTLKRVFRVLPGKGDFLWLVTEKGTLRLNGKNGELTPFPMFPTLSEMGFHLLPGYTSQDGTLYIGTSNGKIHAFDPEMLYKKGGFDQRFPVAITRLEFFNEKQDSLFIQQNNLADLSEIHLSHRDRYFNLEFFVPDFRNSDQLLYSHWLEGYEKDWSTPSRINQLRYENLPPGGYTLYIRGGLTPEYFESSEYTLKVIVAQAWYTTLWAWTVYSIIVLLVGYLLFRYLLKQRMEKAEARRIKELDGLKSRLYTNITHEFRTPLTVIMGIADNIKGHSQEKQLIQRNSENLLRLINQLLDLSKLDSGMLKIDAVQADIINYLQYITESFYSMAKEKQIRLTFYPEVKELLMDFDAEKIQHIIYNLLSNAIKYTPEEGKVILHVRKLKQREQDWLQIKVSDTGKGIDKKDLPHIFDRFYQVEKIAGEGSKTYSGTGIGLALTKELVELMGGQIAVESTPDRSFGSSGGTDFMILLPIQQNSAIQKEVAIPTSHNTRVGENLFSKSNLEVPVFELTTLKNLTDQATLLIIEDNRDVVTYIESLLQKDYQIETARNGQEGIDKALEMIPDIIISDVMMPEKDGYEVCQTLKNDERTSHIPIILLTAKATVEDRIVGLQGGADAYLVKPFNKEELFVRLEKLISLRQTLQETYSGNDLFSKLAQVGNQKIATTQKPSLDELFLQKLIRVVEEKLDDPKLGVVHLCRAVRLSNSQVNRKLKAITGKTPSQFIRSIRLQKALEFLKDTDLNISEIAYQVGFSDPNYFSRSFSQEFGYPPNNIRK